PATLEDGAGGPALRLAAADGRALVLPLDGAGGVNGVRSREVLLGLRPEAITDPAAAAHGNQGTVSADCLVEVVEPAGSDTFVVTRLGGIEVIARMHADAVLRPGEMAPFAFAMSKAVLFDPQSGARLR